MGLNSWDLVTCFITLLTELPQGVYAQEMMNDVLWPVSSRKLCVINLVMD